MIKIVGCFMLFSGCCMFGLIKSYGYKQRSDELDNIIEILKLLTIEITYKKDSLWKSFRNVSKAKECWFSNVLNCCSLYLYEENSLNESWHAAVKEWAETGPLKNQEIEVLNDLMLGLGRSDTDGQSKILEPSIIRLQAIRDKAVATEQKQGKMYKSLGMAVGLVIVILII